MERIPPGLGVPMIRIVIADDHQIFRAGLRLLLEAEPGFEVAGEAAEGAEAVRLVGELDPDILLLDLAMPGMPGLEALRQIFVTSARVRTIVLTGNIDRGVLVKALQLGARGVVTKESVTDYLFKGIRSVMEGEYWIRREGVSDLVEELRSAAGRWRRPAAEAANAFGLTPRELEIAGAVAVGYPNKEIARQLTITEDTVKRHLSSIFGKTGVSSRIELAMFAVDKRLVDAS